MTFYKIVMRFAGVFMGNFFPQAQNVGLAYTIWFKLVTFFLGEGGLSVESHFSLAKY